MKTFFRVLKFASPLSRFVPRYAVLTILSVVFGLVNISLIIPLLNVLFKITPVSVPLTRPEPSLNLAYPYHLFNYYFDKTLREEGGFSALLYVCIIIFITIFLAN